MGNYVTSDDVQGLIADFTFSSTTEPSTDDVEMFVTIVEAMVDGNLHALGYSTPVTATQSAQVLRAITLQGVMAYTLSAMGSLKSDIEGTRESGYWARFQTWLDNLVQSQGLMLIDAARMVLGGVSSKTVTIGNQLYDRERFLPLEDFTKIRANESQYQLGKARLRPREFWGPEFR